MVQGTTQASHPRFRQDLVAEPIEEQGARFIDVIDPDSGNGFRFYEVEYSLACAMDGERDVEGIVRWATEELGVTPSTSEVRTVIATLGELGYLEGFAQAAASAASAASAVAVDDAPIAIAPAATPRGLDIEIAPAAAPTRANRPTPSAPIDDSELAHGIVVGKTAAAAVDSGGDFELGHVGRSAPVDDSPTNTPEFALGAPGRAEPPRGMPSRPKVDDIPLGVAGAGSMPEIEVQPDPEAVPQVADMSLDLSDHIAVRPDDVKEAVRQSRVMSAVDVPKELMEQLDAPAKAEPAKPPRAPTPVPTPPPAATTKPGAGAPMPGPAPVPAPVVAKTPAAKAADKAAKPAVDLPKQVAKQAAATPEPAKSAPPAPASRISPALIAIAIVVVIAAAGFAVWKYVLAEPDDAADEIDNAPKHAHKQPGPTAEAAKPAPVTPPAPVEPSAPIALDQPTPQAVKAGTAGAIEMVAANDTVVKAGDVIAKLAGHAAIDTDLAALSHDIDKRVPAEITKAEADLAAANTANNKAGAAAAQAQLDDRKKSLETKQAAAAAKQAELAKFMIKAPIDGKVTAVAKVGAKVADTDVVANVVGGPTLSASFDVTPTDTRKVNDAVTLKVGDKQLACTVASLDGGKLKASCPVDASIAAGANAALATPATPAPTAPAPAAPAPAAPAPAAPAPAP